MPDDIDPSLEARYFELFRSYGTGGSDVTVKVKQRIVEHMHRREPPLRGDAAYFLLVNIDHMFIRPCVGAVMKGGEVVSPFKYESADRITDDVVKVTDLVLEQLLERGPRASSHDVMWAIEQQWPEINGIFLWA